MISDEEHEAFLARMRTYNRQIMISWLLIGASGATLLFAIVLQVLNLLRS